jgi:hypothetical protein
MIEPLTLTPEREAAIRSEHTEPADGRCDACDLLAEIEALRAQSQLRLLALRNVRALAMRIRRKSQADGDHPLRFCESAGVVANIMRGGDDE